MRTSSRAKRRRFHCKSEFQMFWLISSCHVGVPKSYTNMASPYKSMGVLQSSRISFLQVVFSTLKLSNARQIKIADRTFS